MTESHLMLICGLFGGGFMFGLGYYTARLIERLKSTSSQVRQNEADLERYKLMVKHGNHIIFSSSLQGIKDITESHQCRDLLGGLRDIELIPLKVKG